MSFLDDCVCSVCGCRGIHACMGQRMPKRTEEEMAHDEDSFRTAIREMIELESKP